MKHYLHFLHESIFGYLVLILMALSIVLCKTTLAQVNIQNISKPSSVPAYDTIGSNLVEKKVLLLWINPAFINSTTINDTNRITRPFSDFVSIGFLDSLPINIQKDFVRAEAYKIFPLLTENDSISISRTGSKVKIPPFYTALHVYFSDPTSDIEVIHDSTFHRYNLFTSVEYNLLIDYMFVPNDPNYCNSQKSLHDNYYDSLHNLNCNGGIYDINVNQAWNYSVGKSCIRVGIHDSGIMWNHEDFYFSNGDPKITEGVNYYDPSTSCHDYVGHGTMMAGIIGAVTHNNIGIAGIAGGSDWREKGASIIDMTLGPIPYLSLFYSSVIDGANSSNVSGGKGLHIMNFSLGWTVTLPMQYPADFQLLKSAIQFSYKNGVVMSCASGNNASNIHDTIFYPACFRDDWVLNVCGARNNQNASVYGANPQLIDILAPGGHRVPADPNNQDNRYIYTTIDPTYNSGNEYIFTGQTSPAAAHASGVAALLLSYYNDSLNNPRNLSPEDAEHLLEIGTIDNYEWRTNWYDVYPLGYHYTNSGWDYFGWGRLNAFYSLWHLDSSYFYFRHIDTSIVLSPSILGTAQTISAITPSEDFNGYYSSSVYNASAYPISVLFNFSIPVNVEIDTVWVRNSSSNLWGQPHLNGATWQFTPEDSAMLVAFNGYSATVTGYEYNLNGSYRPLSMGDTVHIGLSIYGHYTNAIGFNEIPSGDYMKIFPNPVNEGVTITLRQPVDEGIITIFDISGATAGIFTFPSGRSQTCVETAYLSEGIYFLRFQNHESSFVKKLVISH